MKRLVLILGILFIFSTVADAQMCGGMMGQRGQMRHHGMMGEGMQMPMIQMCQQMMGHSISLLSC